MHERSDQAEGPFILDGPSVLLRRLPLASCDVDLLPHHFTRRFTRNFYPKMPSQ